MSKRKRRTPIKKLPRDVYKDRMDTDLQLMLLIKNYHRSLLEAVRNASNAGLYVESGRDLAQPIKVYRLVDAPVPATIEND